ncbi:hypothetical protein [Pseudonocardia pini]|uniref:hypothetical protein n=1 Tax=Pseudonocardia pini TaxID=2758030 RepID=UPI0015F069DB|nr:hypothetical protein [Pseudonocardia pini]
MTGVLCAALALDALVFVVVLGLAVTAPRPRHRLTRAAARRSRITLRGATTR